MQSRILLALLLTLGLAWTQPPIKHSDPNPSVQITLDPSSSIRKSQVRAIAQSLVLPGSGEYYLGHTQRAKALIAADLSLWLGLFISLDAEKRALKSAHEYAVRHASNSQLSTNTTLLQNMADWRSRSGTAGNSSNPEPGTDYNLDQLRSGLAVDADMPNTPDYQWDWESMDNENSSTHIAHYKDLLSAWRGRKISSQLIIGGLILNRVVSLVDVVVLSRRSMGLEMSSDLTTKSMQLTLNGEF